MSVSYTINDIDVNLGLEGPRKKPGMYIGDTGIKGFHHLLWEVIDNSLDEFSVGYGSRLSIRIAKDGYAVVQDFGRGIPMEVHPVTQKSGIETVLTVLHAGGKMGNVGGYEGKRTGGTHGVGVSVTNALSEHLEVTVVRERKRAFQVYEKGKKVSEHIESGSNLGKVGTTIKFKPDPEIFGEELTWNDELILQRLEYMSYITEDEPRPNCQFDYVNEMTGKKKTFHSISGSFEYGANVLCRFGLLPDAIVFKNNDFHIGIQVSAKRLDQPFISFVNRIPTPKGGPHVSGVKTAMVKFFNAVSVKKNFTSNQIIENSFFLLSIKVEEPSFTSQHKEELSEDKKIQGKVSSWLYQELMSWYNDDPKAVGEYIKLIEKRINSDKEEKTEDENVKYKGKFSNKKLTKATFIDPNRNELFIVEGDSAGGSAKKAKNDYQAVLPLRGKIINPIKESWKKVFESAEVQAIISALGGIGDDFNIEKCPYIRVNIMTDADNDGAHIQTLLIAFFYKYYRSLIEAGRICVACPPLFYVDHNKKRTYFYSVEEMQKFTKGKKGFVTKRFKGLGEMNPDDLKKTAMNPDTRTLIQLKLDDIVDCDHIVDGLMGSDTGERKKLVHELFA